MQSNAYLTRYRSGEYEQVWSELVALGGHVQADPLHSEALAVAAEMMQRVKANVETVIERLRTLDYHFAHPDDVYSPPGPDVHDRLARVERLAGAVPISLRTWYEGVGSLDLTGDHPVLSTYAAKKPSVSRAAFSLAEQARLGAILSRRFEAFCKERGVLLTDRDAQRQFQDLYPDEHAALRQTAARPLPATIYSDPLVVYPLPALSDSDETWHTFLGLDDEDSPDHAVCTIAPDVYHKANVSGGDPYEIALPNQGVDGLLTGGKQPLLFIEYLRLSFRWGGFPGLAGNNSPTEIAFLRDGLLPF